MLILRKKYGPFYPCNGPSGPEFGAQMGPFNALVVKSQLPRCLVSSLAPTLSLSPIPPPPRRRDLAAPAPASAGALPRHGDAEPDASVPQVPRRAAPRPRAGGGSVVVIVRRRRRRRRRGAGDRDGLAAALQPPLRPPQHRRPLRRLQVTTPLPPPCAV